MTASIISGKELAQEKRRQLAEEVKGLKEQGITPGLTIILVGDNPASLSYIKGNRKRPKKSGLLLNLNIFQKR